MDQRPAPALRVSEEDRAAIRAATDLRDREIADLTEREAWTVFLAQAEGVLVSSGWHQGSAIQSLIEISGMSYQTCAEAVGQVLESVSLR
jgi:hypothetical protein